MSVVGVAMLQHELPDTPWRPFSAAFGYAFGFVIAIIGGLQLFTESTTMAGQLSGVPPEPPGPPG